ncbi:hypothetical protein Scep_029762 [Stephania cephalantha]|uniref:Uncharacterized protein n=1 Tax=Stephania cephalantha TaxID=152367 RepID=A0AAP0DYC8_9MAGN
MFFPLSYFSLSSPKQSFSLSLPKKQTFPTSLSQSISTSPPSQLVRPPHTRCPSLRISPHRYPLGLLGL